MALLYRFLISLIILPLMLYRFMVAHSATCQTLSNAFLKSTKMWYRSCWCWRYLSHIILLPGTTANYVTQTNEFNHFIQMPFYVMGYVGFTPGNYLWITMADGGRASWWSGQRSRSPGRAPGCPGRRGDCDWGVRVVTSLCEERWTSADVWISPALYLLIRTFYGQLVAGLI